MGRLKGRRCESPGRTEGLISGLLFPWRTEDCDISWSQQRRMPEVETKQEQRTCGD